MVNFLLNFDRLPMVFNAYHYQDLYDTCMIGCVCHQRMELMAILLRYLKPDVFYAKKKDIIGSG
jgi:hypothetical protein